MITPSQIRQKKISTVDGGGYDRNEVNELLLEIIESYEAVYAENKELYRKMEILANRIEEYRADEDTIKNALIAAQKTADKLMNDTKQKAAQSLEESAKTAQKTVVDAKEKAAPRPSRSTCGRVRRTLSPGRAGRGGRRIQI